MFVRAAYFIGRPRVGHEAALDRCLQQVLPMYADLPGIRRVELQRVHEAEPGTPAGLYAVLHQSYDGDDALRYALASPHRTRLRGYFMDEVMPLFDGSVVHVNHWTHDRCFHVDDALATESALLARMFTDARSHQDFLDVAVPENVLLRLYELMKWGPTAFNSGPVRIQFVCSTEAKQRLLSCMSPGNVAKVQAAPVIAIVGMDLDFPATLQQLFPQVDARSWFGDNTALVEEAAFRNSSLQGGYLIMAARAIGLDCGPMSGFDRALVDRAFWAGTAVRTNFLCAMGYGRAEALHARNPRLPFDTACRVV